MIAARHYATMEAGMVAKTLVLSKVETAVSQANSWLQQTLPLGQDALEMGRVVLP